MAFSLSFENDYPNLLTMLELGRVPLLSAARRTQQPLVAAGGVSAFLNPEPLADFCDLFLLGEAEAVLHAFCAEAARQHGETGACSDLAGYRGIRGCYIPSGYAVRYGRDGGIAAREPQEGFPERVASPLAADIDRHSPASSFVSRHTEFSDMGLLEVSRGCARRCRFCAVGSVYSPYRQRSAETLLGAADGLCAFAERIGLMGAAVADYPQLASLIRALREKGVTVSVSSLRADALTDEIIGLLQQCGHKTFTIAPEAGSERLRVVIGKRLSEVQIDAAARALARCRVPFIKLYFMVGLPTETADDVRAIVELTRRIKHSYYQEARAEKWLNRIQLSVSPFVPKPWTAFQWAAFEDVAALKRKIRLITSGLRAERKVQVTCDLPKWGYVQALLSRGDRRVGRMLLKAHELGGDWGRALRACEINPDFFACRERGRDEILPWDFIDHRFTKEQLWAEYREALEGR